MDNQVVSKEEWLEARRRLLAEEKEFTQARDALSKKRRELPWVRVEQPYSFTGRTGSQQLADLFEGCSQLIVYHFMYGPEWEQGCPSCSFWADNYNGILVHLAHRDIRLVVASNAPIDKLLAYQKRMGWDGFEWYSTLGSEFNRDFHVTFSPAEMAAGEVFYNFRKTSFPVEEAPGLSVFYKNDQGEVFHTYSCYARGLDMLNGAYHHMDLVPKGRDEEDLPSPMAWLRRHDQYE